MSWSKGMTFANIDHNLDAKVTMEKKKVKIGHNSSNGDSPWDRMDKYGQWGGTVGENLSYGAMNGMNAVIQLYIDDGVASRGHRKNLTNPEFKVMGAAAGEFPKYGNIMTQNFAKTFKEAPENYPSRRRLHADEEPQTLSELHARKLDGWDDAQPDQSNINYGKDNRKLDGWDDAQPDQSNINYGKDNRKLDAWDDAQPDQSNINYVKDVRRLFKKRSFN